MNNSEKILYSQIHPAKLFTDISMSIVSLYLFWYHYLIPALVIHVVPSIVVSYAIIRFSPLENYKRSPLGHMVGRYMTPAMQVLRLVGDIMTVVGAWFQTLWIIGVGLALILFGWTRGIIFP